MTGVIGAAVSLWTLPETTYGTAASGNYHQLGIMSASLGGRRNLLDVRVLGLGTGRNPTDPMLGELSVEGDVEVPVNHDGFGHWLRLLFGAPATTGTAPNYTHVFTSGADSLPSNTVVLDYGAALGTNRYMRSLGMRANTMSVSFGVSGPATARLGLVGQTNEMISAAGAGTPVVVAGPLFNKVNGTITKGGATLGMITEATLEFSNNIEALRTIRDDNRIAAAIPENVTVGGRLTARFADGGLQAEALANTPVDLSIGWGISATREIRFRVPRAFLSLPQAPIDGPGGVSVVFDIIGSAESVAGAMIVTLENSVASYA